MVSDLYLETYVDDLGHLQVVDTVFLIQHLFLTFPRIVFLLGFVVVLSFLLGSYLCFSLYLATTSGREVTEPGADIAPRWPGPHQQSPRFTRAFTFMGFGVTFKRSLYLLLHIMKERRNKDGKSVNLWIQSHTSAQSRINTEIQKQTGLDLKELSSFPGGTKFWIDVSSRKYRWTEKQTKKTNQSVSLFFLMQQRIHLHHLETSSNGYAIKPNFQSLMQPLGNILLTMGKSVEREEKLEKQSKQS